MYACYKMNMFKPRPLFIGREDGLILRTSLF